jgi:hypothetical protein
MSRYGNIRYVLPPKQPADYAARAINILEAIQKEVPRMLPVFLSANAVLTLSGVRAYDAYHEFYDFYSQEERQAVRAVLQRHGVHSLDSGYKSSEGEGARYIFELLNDGGLQQLADTYKMPGGEHWPYVKAEAYTARGFLVWSQTVERWLHALQTDDSLPRDWLPDRMVPHDLRFGMLLGYPAVAIESSVWLNISADKHGGELPEGEQLMQARIRHHDAYFAAWPVYNYDNDLRHDPAIEAHEELWSAILDTVYGSEWHRQLQEDAAFQEVLQTITRLEGQPV